MAEQLLVLSLLTGEISFQFVFYSGGLFLKIFPDVHGFDCKYIFQLLLLDPQNLDLLLVVLDLFADSLDEILYSRDQW